MPDDLAPAARPVDAERAQQVADWLRAARSIVVLTGAGISTESGIPDFRGPSGMWTKNPDAEKMATIQHYMSDRDVRVRSWRNRLDSRMWSADPNRGHFALAELAKKAAVDLLVTQNVDGLHQAAGFPDEQIVEIHGTVQSYTCMRCGQGGPINEVLDRVRAGEDDPECRDCSGILKTATISFGQNLVMEDLDRSRRASAGCDVFLAIGTSLTVTPVAWLPQGAIQAGARLVIINAQETPYDDAADALFDGRIGEVLPDIVQRI